MKRSHTAWALFIFARTSMTKQEYDAERRKLRESGNPPCTREKGEVDPRYEQWVP